MTVELLERRLLFALYGPDVSFGDGGRTDIPADSVIKPLPDGKIFVLGHRVIPPNPDIFDDISTYITTASRVNADGTLDTTYGENGQIEFDEADTLSRPATLVGSTIYIGWEGSAGRNRIHAYTLDGQPDTSFGGDGIAEV